MSRISADWLRAACDDIEAIRVMLLIPSLTNIASFHAEQAVEKSFKALLEHLDLPVVKTHDLIRLYKQIEVYIPLDVKQIDLLMRINELYIDFRYPGDLGLLPDGKPSVSMTESFLALSEYVYNAVVSIVNSGKI